MTRRPATCSATCCSASPPTSTPPSAPPAPPSTTWSDTSVVRRARVMFAFRELIVAAHRRARADHRRRARQDRRGRQGRGHPRHGGRRVRVRDRGAHQGRVLRPGLHRRRPALVPPAARRVRGDHAVQLPDHGPDVDAPGGDRDREHVRAQAVRARPVASRNFIADLYAAGRACRTASSTSSTATRSRSTRSSTTRTSTPSRFVGSTPIAKYIHERATAAGKRVQALGGAKNHAIVMPDADLDFASDQLTAAGYGSAGPALHGDLASTVAVGDAADELVEKLRAKALDVKVGPGLEPDVGDGPAGHRRRRATASSTTSAAARATSSSTAASSRSRATASGSARR